LDKYRLSFTTGGLYFRESEKLVELYMQHGDWSEIRKVVLEENTLQLNTHSSQVRTYREVSSRLQQLSKLELELLEDSVEQEKRYLLWLAICRQYKFIEEFSIEVLREKFLAMNMTLTYHDYDIFFNRKAEWHEELDGLSLSTKNKLKQVLFRILREAGLLSKDNLILPAILTPRVAREIFKQSKSQPVIYPISDIDLGGLIA